MPKISWYSGMRFGVWRIFFGLYLTIYSLLEFPYRHEFFGSDGVMPSPISPSIFTTLTLQSIYRLFWSDHLITPLHVLGLVASVMIAVGLFRRWAAGILFVCSFILINRNIVTSGPEGQLVSWLILFCAFVPSGESYSILPKSDDRWKMPLGFLVAAWLTLSVAYFLGGISKISDEAWLDGTAIRLVYFIDVSRFDWMDKFQYVPYAVSAALTYGALVTEVGFLFALPFAFGRKWWWFSSVAMNIVLLFTLELQKINLGMLIFSALLFDPRWLPQRFRGTEQIQEIG